MARSCENSDLVGQKFCRLLVLSRAPSRHGNAYWLCRCDCGKTKAAMGYLLKTGHVKSCGCLRKELALGLLPGARAARDHELPDGEAAFNVMFYTYQQHAMERDLAFNLGQDEFRRLTKQKCFYCKQAPQHVFKPKSPNGGYLGNGIDRIDNALGYTAENSFSCCRICNRMKSDMTYDDFIAHCLRITRGFDKKPSAQTE